VNFEFTAPGTSEENGKVESAYATLWGESLGSTQHDKLICRIEKLGLDRVCLLTMFHRCIILQ
jgi:hypothetical protein